MFYCVPIPMLKGCWCDKVCGLPQGLRWTLQCVLQVHHLWLELVFYVSKGCACLEDIFWGLCAWSTGAVVYVGDLHSYFVPHSTGELLIAGSFLVPNVCPVCLVTFDPTCTVNWFATIFARFSATMAPSRVSRLSCLPLLVLVVATTTWNKLSPSSASPLARLFVCSLPTSPVVRPIWSAVR